MRLLLGDRKQTTFQRGWRFTSGTHDMIYKKLQSNLELRTILVTRFLVLKVKLVLILTVQVMEGMFYLDRLQFATKPYHKNSILTQR